MIKMNNYKRLLSFILLASLSFAAAIGCAANDEIDLSSSIDADSIHTPAINPTDDIYAESALAPKTTPTPASYTSKVSMTPLIENTPAPDPDPSSNESINGKKIINVYVTPYNSEDVQDSDSLKIIIGSVDETPEPTEEPMQEVYYVAGYVNENFVNLRQEPTTESDVIKVFRLGTPLYVTAKNEEWYRVEIDGCKGYMARDYIMLGQYATPTPKPTPTPTPKPTYSMYKVHEGQFSESEIRLVAALIHCEGRGSSQLGYRAIASVVLNRVMNSSGWFPNTVEGVIFQPGQFAGYTKEYLDSVTPNSAALAAARYVFGTHGATLPKKVLFYRASSCGYYWTNYTKFYAQIEGNNYYFGLYHY